MKLESSQSSLSTEKQPQDSVRGWRKVVRSVRGTCFAAACHSGRGLKKTFAIAMKCLLVLYFLFAILFLLLRYVVLPGLENYKTDIEQFASRKMGRQVQIDKIQAGWQNFNPQLTLNNVVIHDQLSKPALSLPEVRTSISWWSLLVLDIRFDKIAVLKPSLKVLRDREGTIQVAGFPIKLKQQVNQDEAGIDWVLAQHQISIQDGQISWDDQLQENPVLELNEVNFVLENQWHKHRFALRAKPPAVLAAPVDIRGSFTQSVFAHKKSELVSWSGELYSDLRKADLPLIHQYFPLPVKLDKGVGTLRSWLKMDRGRIVDFTADVRLQDVLGKFRRDLPILDMAQVSGRIIASERIADNNRYMSWMLGQAGHSLALVDFSMQTRDGLLLPATTLKETFTPGEKGQGEKVELYAQSLDLHSLANFAEHLPIPLDQRRLLIDVAPKGVLKEFSARWQGSFPEISSYSIKGHFSNLEMQPQKAQLARPKVGKTPAKAAVPAIPGFDNLSGSIDANDKGGSFTLDSHDLVLQLPSYFVDPLMPFKRLQMQAQWQFAADDKLLFQIHGMEFEQDGAIASLSGKHVLSMRQQDLGEVDISGRLNGFDLKTINRYIPAHTPDDLRFWLSNALLDGTANDVVFRLKGPLTQFPFHQKEGRALEQGEFLVKGNIQAGKLNFLPGAFAKDGAAPYWPMIENIKGSFVFDRARMEIRADSGMTNGVTVSKVKAIIPDLVEHNSVLQIDGIASGGLQNMLGYVKASPVDDWLGNFLHDTVATGNAQLGLKLQLPLHTIIDSKVQGVLQLGGNDTNLQPDLPLITGLNGRIEFNERGLNLGNLKASMLGGAVQASGGTQKDGVIRIKLDGVANADGIRKHFADVDLGGLLTGLNGESRYFTQINVKQRQTEVIVESGLQGLGWNLPAPLNKAANDNLALRFELLPDGTGLAGELREQIKLSVGSRLNAHYQRKKLNEKNAKWQVTRGSIAVNAPAILPDNGLSVHVETKSLNVDDWRRLLEKNTKLPETNSVSAASNLQNTQVQQVDRKKNPDIAQYLEPNSFSVSTDELFLFGKKLDNIVLGASHQFGLWQANLDSKQASGYLTWNGLGNQQSNGQLTARLNRLMIPKSAASDVGDLLEAKNTTKQIPNLDIQVDNFELFDKKLGRLDLFASNSLAALGREWHIDKLNLKNDDAELNASGKWVARANDSQTNLRYVLDIANSGKLLDRLDFLGVMRGGKGRLEGDLEWRGLPFDIDIPSLSGQLQLKLAAGQFLKVDPGGAKLLGVLSMQSLPRRFTLDFGDVFSEGFAFDSIVGTAKIQHGIASTDNLKMSSVSAAVLMEGYANIAKESQDLHVVVIPDFNVGAASVVYGLVVNPVIGLGTFLAQLFFRDPLKRALTYELQITGPWKNPVVTKIENKERQQILEKQKAEQSKAEQDKNKAEVK
ncbi:YhdP family protein [Undibacterium sp. Di24W]